MEDETRRIRAEQERKEYEMKCRFEAEKKKMEQRHRAELERKERDLTAYFNRMMPPSHSSPDQQGPRKDQFCQETRYEHSQYYDQSSPHFRRSYESPGVIGKN